MNEEGADQSVTSHISRPKDLQHGGQRRKENGEKIKRVSMKTVKKASISKKTEERQNLEKRLGEGLR